MITTPNIDRLEFRLEQVETKRRKWYKPDEWSAYDRYIAELKMRISNMIARLEAEEQR
jgi:hypothetical protein